MSNTKIVVHGNCPDGSAAALISKLIDKDVDVIYGKHSSINKEIKNAALEIEPYGRLWVVDISCDRDVLDECIKILKYKKGKLGVYEHHISRSWLAEYQSLNHSQKENNIEIIYDEKRCGSKVFYDALMGKSMNEKQRALLLKYKEFIEATNDRDLWINKHPWSVILARLHAIYGDREYVERFLKNREFVLSDSENILLEYTEKKRLEQTKKLLKNVILGKDSNNFEYGIVYGDAISSDFLNELLEKTNIEYGILANLHTQRASIRSKGKFDCAAYSSKRGGGGHRLAAGFKLNFKYPKVEID